jgi:hypothetical protein
MSSVYFNKSRNLYVHCRVIDFKRVRKSLRTRDKKVALDMGARLDAQYDKQMEVSRGAYTNPVAI